MVLGPVWDLGYTNSRSGPGTSLGPVTLTVGVVLGPVWDLGYTNSRSGPGTSLGPVALTVGVVLGPVWACCTDSSCDQRPV